METVLGLIGLLVYIVCIVSLAAGVTWVTMWNASGWMTAAYLSKYGGFYGIPTALAGVLWFGVVGFVAWGARSTEKPSAA